MGSKNEAIAFDHNTFVLSVLIIYEYILRSMCGVALCIGALGTCLLAMLIPGHKVFSQLQSIGITHA